MKPSVISIKREQNDDDSDQVMMSVDSTEAKNDKSSRSNNEEEEGEEEATKSTASTITTVTTIKSNDAEEEQRNDNKVVVKREEDQQQREQQQADTRDDVTEEREGSSKRDDSSKDERDDASMSSVNKKQKPSSSSSSSGSSSTTTAHVNTKTNRPESAGANSTSSSTRSMTSASNRRSGSYDGASTGGGGYPYGPPYRGPSSSFGPPPPPPTLHGGPRHPGVYHPHGPPHPNDHYPRGPPTHHPHYHPGMHPIPHPGGYGGPPFHPLPGPYGMSGPPRNFHPAPYGHPPFGGYPHFHAGGGAPPGQHGQQQQQQPKQQQQQSQQQQLQPKKSNATDNSKGGSRKKRSIDESVPLCRTSSNASTLSTITAGNNTSTETPNLSSEGSPNKQNNQPPPSHYPSHPHHPRHGGPRHRRDHSAGSTASTLSVGGFSMSSYDGPRGGGNNNDAPMIEQSPKRRRGHDGISIEAGQRIEKLSMDDNNSTSGAADSHRRSESNSRNLFLSLSTSPINSDHETSTSHTKATPHTKNTKKKGRSYSDLTESKTEDDDNKDGNGTRKFEPSDTPTPPVASMAERDMMTDEHMLNQHLRSQTFTPLSHLNHTEGHDSMSNSPTLANQAAYPAIQTQLSWSIAGDAPSLGDLSEWDEDHQLSSSNKKSASKIRPDSAASNGTRGMALTPSSFSMMKEEVEGIAASALKNMSPHSDVNMNDGGTTTPLPFFFGHSESGEERENMDHRQSSKEKDGKGDKSGSRSHHSNTSGGMRPEESEHSNQQRFGGSGGNTKGSDQYGGPSPWRTTIYPTNNGMKGGDPHSSIPPHMHMPPTPVFSDQRDDGYGRSPHANRDGALPDFFPSNSMYGSHPGMVGHDRVRNLRGRGMPGPPAMHIQVSPSFAQPPHSLISPVGLPSNGGKGMWGANPPSGSHHSSSPHHNLPAMDLSSSKRKCVPLKPPIPSKFQGDMEKTKKAEVPEFTGLVNYPAHMSQKQSINLPEGMRCCVMCGQARPCSTGNKNKKSAGKALVGGKAGMDGGLAQRNSNGQDLKDKSGNSFALIPTQNKGLCTLCDVNVWVVTQTGLEIKWCKGCKNFRPWAAFGDKGLATKCLRCRERQREKYALQKEEKERARSNNKGLAKSRA